MNPIDMLKNCISKKLKEKVKRNIWENSEFKEINGLEIDDIGKIGEDFLQKLCSQSNIPANINGIKNKQVGGGYGDGTINGKTIEIKTARQGSGKSANFQHELGEKPWKANFMCFIDISPESIYISVFPNFTENHYKKSGKSTRKNPVKCDPVFPTKSITWRKKIGSFKLDTTVKINETNNNYTFKIISGNTYKEEEFNSFINKIINPTSNVVLSKTNIQSEKSINEKEP
jgi:hypothetical protein